MFYIFAVESTSSVDPSISTSFQNTALQEHYPEYNVYDRGSLSIMDMKNLFTMGIAIKLSDFILLYYIAFQSSVLYCIVSLPPAKGPLCPKLCKLHRRYYFGVEGQQVLKKLKLLEY